MKTPIATALTLTLTVAATPTPPPTTTITIENKTITVEIAHTPQAQTQGLSNRHTLPPHTGMLFPLNRTQKHHVWMARMNFPIDIAWITDHHITATDTLEPCTTPNPHHCQRWQAPHNTDALLELPAGTLTNTTPGTKIHTTKTKTTAAPPMG